ncbi:MAG: hypothetical protein EZS28_045687, partial [Streblomastix strix]
MNLKIVSMPHCGRASIATSTIEAGGILLDSKP